MSSIDSRFCFDGLSNVEALQEIESWDSKSMLKMFQSSKKVRQLMAETSHSSSFKNINLFLEARLQCGDLEKMVKENDIYTRIIINRSPYGHLFYALTGRLMTSIEYPRKFWPLFSSCINRGNYRLASAFTKYDLYAKTILTSRKKKPVKNFEIDIKAIDFCQKYCFEFCIDHSKYQLAGRVVRNKKIEEDIEEIKALTRKGNVILNGSFDICRKLIDSLLPFYGLELLEFFCFENKQILLAEYIYRHSNFYEQPKALDLLFEYNQFSLIDSIAKQIINSKGTSIEKEHLVKFFLIFVKNLYYPRRDVKRLLPGLFVFKKKPIPSMNIEFIEKQTTAIIVMMEKMDSDQKIQAFNKYVKVKIPILEKGNDWLYKVENHWLEIIKNDSDSYSFLSLSDYFKICLKWNDWVFAEKIVNNIRRKTALIVLLDPIANHLKTMRKKTCDSPYENFRILFEGMKIKAQISDKKTMPPNRYYRMSVRKRRHLRKRE